MTEYLRNQDICDLFKCRRTKAYEIIKVVNQKLKANGYQTYKGRVLRRELYEMYGIKEEVENGNKNRNGPDC